MKIKFLYCYYNLTHDVSHWNKWWGTCSISIRVILLTNSHTDTHSDTHSDTHTHTHTETMHKIYLLVSQLGPLKPASQLHVWLFSPSIHVPPFKQGFGEHSSISESISEVFASQNTFHVIWQKSKYKFTQYWTFVEKNQLFVQW